MQAPRSAYEEVGGIVFFGRMLDKIRLKAAGTLPDGYATGTKNWFAFDSRCCRLLGIKYPALRKRVLQGGSDLEILKWAFREGRKPGKEEMEIWNAFMKKRGWRDPAGLAEEKKAAGLGGRKDIQTFFDLFDAEEGRKPRRAET